MFVNLSSIVRYGEECYNSVVFYTPHRLCGTRQAKAATFGGTLFTNCIDKTFVDAPPALAVAW